MEALIKEYAKRLKLSWVRQHYLEVEANTNEEYLLRILESELQQREVRKTNLLFKQSSLPRIAGKPFEWSHIQMGQGLTSDHILNGHFIENQENLIFYGGVGTGKTYLSTLIGLNAIQKQGRKIKFFTVAGLVNRLLDAHETGSLSRFFNQIEKLDLLILDELGIFLCTNREQNFFSRSSLCAMKEKASSSRQTYNLANGIIYLVILF